MKNINIENNSEHPINPTWVTQNGERSHRPLKQGEKTNYESLLPGLTKREYAAIKAMQGILASDSDRGEAYVAQKAVVFADALLSELEKSKP